MKALKERMIKIDKVNRSICRFVKVFNRAFQNKAKHSLEGKKIIHAF